MVESSSGLRKTNPASGSEEDLNPGPPDYKSNARTTRPRRLPGKIKEVFAKPFNGAVPFVVQGRSCEFCEPLFVGDARNNGSCVSCYNECNHKALVCMNSTQLEYGRSRNFSFEPSEVRAFLIVYIC